MNGPAYARPNCQPPSLATLNDLEEWRHAIVASTAVQPGNGGSGAPVRMHGQSCAVERTAAR
ncbi:hypothetical protein GCM10009608_71110 [Pseudonocardia alaniniphila]